jgi:hypothetical protein
VDERLIPYIYNKMKDRLTELMIRLKEVDEFNTHIKWSKQIFDLLLEEWRGEEDELERVVMKEENKAYGK